MDRFDISDMLSGQNVISLDVKELERVDIQEIIEGLLLHYEQISQLGRDPYIEQLQRKGRFNAFENEAAGLVVGFKIDPLNIRRIPEIILRSWIIGYLELLSKERRKIERITTSVHRFGGF